MQQQNSSTDHTSGRGIHGDEAAVKDVRQQ